MPALASKLHCASRVAARQLSAAPVTPVSGLVQYRNRPGPRTSVQFTTRAVASQQVVSTDQAPAALGPYSQAIKAGNTLYVSGQLGIVAATKKFASETDVEAQTDQALKNMGAILSAAGGDFSNVVKTTVLLADMDDFAKVNGVYGKYFTSNPPARACFAVKTLPLNARVEIEAVAVL